MDTPAGNSPHGHQNPAARPFYRCYFLQVSGCVDKADILDAASDEQALLRALKLLELQPGCAAVEIWQGTRKVFPATRARADVHEFKRGFAATG